MTTETGKVSKIYGRNGMQRIELKEATAGNIVTLQGLTTAQVSRARSRAWYPSSRTALCRARAC